MFQAQDVKKIKTHFVFNNLPRKNHTVYEIVWKNIAEPDRPQMAVWCMCIACWIPKSTNTPQCYIIHTLPIFLSLNIYHMD